MLDVKKYVDGFTRIPAFLDEFARIPAFLGIKGGAGSFDRKFEFRIFYIRIPVFPIRGKKEMGLSLH